MLRVEFHCHTIYSEDSLTRPLKLVEASRRKGLDRVIVTDHNTIAGAVAAKQIDPEHVIIGEEIMTTQGELLAAFVLEEIPANLTPENAIRLLQAQSAFISVSHPFDTQRSGGWQESQLIEILPFVDAIETFNARCMLPRFNQQAAAFAQIHSIPGTVGSDAHAAFELGQASMLLPDFNDASGLRAALLSAQLKVQLSSPFVHLVSRYAVWRKRFSRRPIP